MHWANLSHRQRCRTVASAAAVICDHSQELIDACVSPQRTDPVETITSELLPLCAALKHLGRRGKKILRDRRCGILGRPAWLLGLRSVIQRVPLGNVLVLGTWNYPLLLPGVQTAQALAAGNQVQLKPAPGTETATRILVDCFIEAGVPPAQLTLLASSTDAAKSAIDGGVDLIVLTGAASTGRAVLQAAAPKLSAAIMELSGCDAVVPLEHYDGKRLIDALCFGMRFNASATCIGPRRLLVGKSQRETLMQPLEHAFADLPQMNVHRAARSGLADSIVDALSQGAVDVLGRFDESLLREQGKLHPILLSSVTQQMAISAADIFAPVLLIIDVASEDHAVHLINDCPYRLAASVFGPPAAAKAFAMRLNIGTVTINDLIAPTADPRLPFGGRGQSGFGVTRGDEGLLAMTAPRVISVRSVSFGSGKMVPHLDQRTEFDEPMLHAALQFFHAGGVSKRLRGLRDMVVAAKKR